MDHGAVADEHQQLVLEVYLDHVADGARRPRADAPLESGGGHRADHPVPGNPGRFLQGVHRLLGGVPEVAVGVTQPVAEGGEPLLQGCHRRSPGSEAERGGREDGRRR